ncbi:alpha/beta fold hydrolase [Bradyrhizobium sp. 2TAF24]|uniref:alpha/beta fold hydrolase n=1 Tax=Bradyrhizobium sp. 2TAF24 TaxID=3233011 RepID=UPI003F8E99F4
MSDRLFEPFVRHNVDAGEARIAAWTAGEGPPLLLLHGYPQTHLAWHRIAPQLAERYTVVATDLRGYGDSRGPQGDAAHVNHSKRAMAADQLAVMRHFGFDRFAVIGHDRGARVGYRLALDHPDAVAAFTSLTVIPSIEMWERVDKAFALGAYHWFLFAQPYDLPERLLAGDPDYFLDWTLRKMARYRDRLSETAVAAYRDAFRRPEVRHAMMEDYRAGAGIDLDHDIADRAAGRRLACPVQVLWEEGRLMFDKDPVAVWRGWADAVEGHTIAAGHLLAEETPAEVLSAVLPFLARTWPA